jgi:diguanylate cyclase (GGDEF)-like protein
VDEDEHTIAREIAMDSHSHFETGHRGRTPLAEAGGDDLSDIVFKRKDTVVSGRAPGEFPIVAKVPLETSGQVVGVLLSERSARRRPFSADEVETLLTFATQAGFVLENIRLHYELVQLAFKDELTGQYNLRFFIKRLREEVDRSIRYKHPFAVVICGFDGYTAFNNRYGYALGDKVLKEWGRFLRKSHRACDLVARIGGDQFGVFLPETPLSGVQVVAEKIRKAMESFTFTEEAGLQEIRNRPTVSLGIAEFPSQGLMVEQILDHAHQALNEAKARGGNQAVVLPSKIQEPK